MFAWSIIKLISSIIYALVPIVWTIFFYIYIKLNKCENIFVFLSAILFMYGFLDCFSAGLTLLGIEWFLKVIVMKKNFFHADNLTYFDEEKSKPCRKTIQESIHK